MQWRTRITAILAAVVSLLSVSAQAQTLYAASGGNGNPGSLWVVSPASGQAASVGAITLAGTPIPITGLAVHPYTKVLYGITSNGGVNPRTLVTIDKTNGNATLVGQMPNPGSDIAFGPNGTLYVWQQQQNRLAIVNLSSGGVTPLGASGLAGTSGGGLAVNYAGVPIVSVTGDAGTLDTINTQTGAGTTGVALTGAPQGFALNSMAFDGHWTLFAVDTDGAGPVANDVLVSINLVTGAVTNLGALPGDIDALAFDPGNAGIPTMSEWAMIVMGLLLAATGFVAMRRRG